MTCKSCSKSFPALFLDVVGCRFCDNQFHYDCSGIDRVASNSLKKYSCIAYLCATCMQWLSNNTMNKLLKKIDAVVDRLADPLDVNKLAADVADNRKLINSLLDKPAITKEPQLFHQSQASTSHHNDSLVNRILAPTNLGTAGTGQPVESIIPAVIQDKKYLYVGRIHPSVKQDALVSYVCSKLSDCAADQVDCRLLLSKDRVSDNSISFISFKIGLSVDHFNSLNDSDMWPPGVWIRPFVNRSREQKNGPGVRFDYRQF